MSDERILEVEVREQSSDHICPHFEGMSVNVFDLKWMSPKNLCKGGSQIIKMEI